MGVVPILWPWTQPEWVLRRLPLPLPRPLLPPPPSLPLTRHLSAQPWAPPPPHCPSPSATGPTPSTPLGPPPPPSPLAPGPLGPSVLDRALPSAPCRPPSVPPSRCTPAPCPYPCCHPAHLVPGLDGLPLPPGCPLGTAWLYLQCEAVATKTSNLANKPPPPLLQSPLIEKAFIYEAKQNNAYKETLLQIKHGSPFQLHWKWIDRRSGGERAIPSDVIVFFIAVLSVASWMLCFTIHSSTPEGLAMHIHSKTHTRTLLHALTVFLYHFLSRLLWIAKSKVSKESFKD